MYNTINKYTPIDECSAEQYYAYQITYYAKIKTRIVNIGDKVIEFSGNLNNKYEQIQFALKLVDYYQKYSTISNINWDIVYLIIAKYGRKFLRRKNCYPTILYQDISKLFPKI